MSVDGVAFGVQCVAQMALEFAGRWPFTRSRERFSNPAITAAAILMDAGAGGTR
jgi:hypothetical protein